MKTIVLIITFLIIGSLCADGVPPPGTGLPNDPYQVATLDNLLWLSTVETVWVSNRYIEQTADIEASDTQNWNNGEGFIPIGWHE
jgi:hypothetical protein